MPKTGSSPCPPPASLAPSLSPEPPIIGLRKPEKLIAARQATALARPALTAIATHWLQLAVKRPCAQVWLYILSLSPSAYASVSASAPMDVPKLTIKPSRSSRPRPASSKALRIASPARSMGLRLSRRPYGEWPTPQTAALSLRSHVGITHPSFSRQGRIERS